MHPHFMHRMRRCADAFEEALMMGRHRFHGPGPFAFGFAGGMGLGGRGFRTGRKLGSAELQLVLLALLAERPSYGYELIKAVEERSGGFYAPSPGVVYPALTYLDEVGHASVEAEGTKKRYSITDAGRKHVAENQETVDAIFAQFDLIGSKMGRVREIFSGIDDEELGGSHEIWHARRELKLAMRGKRHASAKEKRRIADILKRAAAEIRGEDCGRREEPTIRRGS